MDATKKILIINRSVRKWLSEMDASGVIPLRVSVYKDVKGRGAEVHLSYDDFKNLFSVKMLSGEVIKKELDAAAFYYRYEYSFNSDGIMYFCMSMI